MRIGCREVDVPPLIVRLSRIGCELSRPRSSD
jgi:hypothetical protein